MVKQRPSWGVNCWQVVVREELLGILKSVLRRHGAVPMDSRLVGFAPPDVPPNAAVLLDRNAAVVALRHEMRGPFAACLAIQADLP